MQNKDLILGIDTSNYKTSVALTDRNGDIVCDLREFLQVKQGEKGLRQSDAFFQHIKAIPGLIEKALEGKNGVNLRAVSAATKPRPVEESYMPVFKAGESIGRSIASALGVDFFEFSHQEGHIEAVKHYSKYKNEVQFLCWHLSGGTCELLKIENSKIEIIGGSKDISAGQLLDRVGVGLGMNFPAGEELDRLAGNDIKTDIFKKIEQDGLWFNLSGIETKALRNLEKPGLVTELFEKISDLLVRVSEDAIAETKIDRIIFSGGVAESRMIRKNITDRLGNNAEFAGNNLSSDNAVGISLLGGKKLWP